MKPKHSMHCGDVHKNKIHIIKKKWGGGVGGVNETRHVIHLYYF